MISKKSKLGLFLLMSVFCVALFSCEKSHAKKNSIENELGIDSDFIFDDSSLSLEDYEDYEFISPDNFFDLDYRPEYPEPESYSGKVNLDNPEASKNPSQSVIPGLRDISDYKTSYHTKKMSLSEYLEFKKKNVSQAEKEMETENSIMIEGEKVSSVDSNSANENSKGGAAKDNSENFEEEENFYVKSWGPNGGIPGEMDNPFFFVEFSLPIVKLEALKDEKVIQKKASEIMTITPALEGKYNFIDSKSIYFYPSEPANPFIKYEIHIGENVKSISGKKLEGISDFSTPVAIVESNPLKLIDSKPGVRKEIHDFYAPRYGLSQNDAKYALLSFNYFMTASEAESVLKARCVSEDNVNVEELSFKLEPYFDANSNIKGNRSRKFYIVLDGNISRGSTVNLECLDSSSSYKTTEKWKVAKPFRSLRYYNRSDYRNLAKYCFEFTIPVKEESVLNSFKISGMELTEKNFEVYDNEVYLKNIKLKPGEKIYIQVLDSLKSVYGDFLENPIGFSIEGEDYAGYVKFLDSGMKMMEAQFPHKLIVEYMNAEKGSAYRLKRSDDPLYTPIWKERFSRTEEDGIEVDVSKRNERQFLEIDLDPYLDNGKGAVSFEADFSYWTYSWSGKKDIRDATNLLNVQVTDLGATVRLGVNKAIVLVRSLSTDKPVSDANVYFTFKDKSYRSKTFKTNKKGIAVLEIDNKLLGLMSEAWKYYDVEIHVETDDDRIVFHPTTHNTWRTGIPASSISTVMTEKPFIFMFTDRGLYKPGETVTFRGIDRNKNLGSFIPFEGKYSVSLEKNSWRDSEVYERKEGTTSSSGGFWGQFKIPEDIEPGNYSIVYKRLGGEKRVEKVLNFTVAFFEKLKIQSELTFEDKTFYAGEIINAKLEASYLAGGYLAGADYSSQWTSYTSRFRPESKLLRKFRFGISDDYESISNVSSTKGKLSENGKTILSCSTSGNKKEGIPYVYKLETYVTDASNQRISSSMGVLVHSSRFYIGIGRPVEMNGFAKKGKNLNFPYILVKPDESILQDMSITSKKIEYSLEREYWTYDYQNSVDDSVYARYNKHIDVESTGEVNLSTTGKISVTPKECGYYTLKLKSRDSEGRLVISEYSFYVTGSGNSWYGRNQDANLINLTADQSIYKPGDTAQVLLESPLPSGDYLITVEREGIFTEEVKHFDEPTNVIEVPIARNYVPVVYVVVSSYSVRKGAPTHEYGEVDVDKPKGYFGATALYVDPQVRAFTVTAEYDKDVYKPGDIATITFTASKAGKPLENAELTVMGVDRAVLDLIDYHVPNPIEYFYSSYNFPLCVFGGDSRDYLMDPVTYSIRNLQGGDSDEEKEEERKDFRPTAFFEPVLMTDKDGKVSYSFKVPDSLTTYRVTIFGVKGELLSLKEDEFAVQNPINVQSVQPQKLRERDTAECGVVITNLDTVDHDVTVTLNIRDPLKNSKENIDMGLNMIPGKAIVDGATKHTVKVTSGNTSVVYFDLAAMETGTVELVYTINSDILNEKLVSQVEIEKTYLLENVALSGTIDYTDKGSKKSTETVVIPSFAEDGVGKLTVTVDASRLGMLGSTVNYLFEYPYGCMEQQSSKVLPLVIFGDYIDVFDMESEVSDVRKCVKSHFRNWKNSQLKDGSFPYWPSGKEDDYYVSLRIAHIYALAKQRNYKSSELHIDINKLVNYLFKNADSESSNDYLKSYLAYTLALLGKEGYCESILEKFNIVDIDNLTILSYIGLAYAEIGDTYSLEMANKFANKIRSYVIPLTRTVQIANSSNSYSSYYYSSSIGQMATIMQLFVTLDPNDKNVDKLLYTLMTECKYGYWQNTATSARVLEAVYTIIKEKKLETTDLVASVELMQKEILKTEIKGMTSNVESKTEYFSSNLISSLKKDSDLPLVFKLNGTGSLFYTATLSYAIPDEMQVARDEGIFVKYDLYDFETEEKILPLKDTNVIALESGKTYKVSIKLDSKLNLYNVALRVPIPSGAEILNSRFVTSGSEANSDTEYGYWWSRCSNQKIYDNEMQCFWGKFDPRYTHNVEFTIRANRRGVYPVTPILAESMYSPECFGRTDGYLYTIK